MIKNYLKAYLKIAKESALLFVQNGILMYIGTIVILSIVAINLLLNRFILGGIIAFFVTAMAMSSYLYIIYLASESQKPDWNDAKAGLYIYMRPIVGLILLRSFLFFTLSLLKLWQLIAIVDLGIWLLLNSIPEVISNYNYEALDAIEYSFKFQIKHIFSWYLPNIILFAAAWFVQNFFMDNFSSIAIGNISFKMALFIILALIIFQMIFGYIMIYRQLLFRYIESGKARHNFKVVK